MLEESYRQRINFLQLLFQPRVTTPKPPQTRLHNGHKYLKRMNGFPTRKINSRVDFPSFPSVPLILLVLSASSLFHPRLLSVAVNKRSERMPSMAPGITLSRPRRVIDNLEVFDVLKEWPAKSFQTSFKVFFYDFEKWKSLFTDHFFPQMTPITISLLL